MKISQANNMGLNHPFRENLSKMIGDDEIRDSEVNKKMKQAARDFIDNKIKDYQLVSILSSLSMHISMSSYRHEELEKIVQEIEDINRKIIELKKDQLNKFSCTL